MAEKKGLFSKLKGMKNIEIIVALLLCGIVVVIFVNSFSVPIAKEGQVLTFAQYTQQVESKMSEVLSCIDKAGKVVVMITYEGGIEYVYAYETTKQTVNGTTTEKKEMVTYQGKPVLVSEKAPKIIGVVVVADGANIASVKNEIIKAVQALLLISPNQIEVYKHK